MTAARLIGLLGGTFDPVHLGHLQPAAFVRDHLPLDELRLVPCRQPAHREAPVAGAEQRLAMLRLAIQSRPGLTLETAELDRDGPSYAVDTLGELSEREPDNVWCWLMGVDAFQSFSRWHRWERILELAHLVVITRPGYALEGDAEALRHTNSIEADAPALRRKRAGGIVLLDAEAPDISATQVRRCLLDGCSPEGLVPPAVADYLQTHPIYTRAPIPS